MVAGVVLGKLMPDSIHVLQRMEFGTGSQINIPIAILIWLMIYPMMLKIDFGSILSVGRRPKGLLITVVVNWLVKPFSMAFFGWLFFRHLFLPLIGRELASQYIAGVIILAAAPCTAMVFVWSNLSDGEPHFTLSQVALNDMIMVFAFAPLVALLLGLSSITVPWETLLLSVALYIVVPIVIAQMLRKRILRAAGETGLARWLRALNPVALAALLTTLVLLFGFQGGAIIDQPLVIAMLAVPILIQVYLNSGAAYMLNRIVGERHCVAAPSALIGASNFFELAVAAAISLFGFHSGAALATVVGVLIEVPVMLSVVRIVNATREWYEAGKAVGPREG
jgi:ACR3 family arsenite transporter